MAENASSLAKPKGSRRKLVGLIAAGVIAVVALLILSLFAFWFTLHQARLQSDIQEEISRAAGASEPIDPASLRSAYETYRDDAELAQQWLAGCRALHSGASSQPLLPEDLQQIEPWPQAEAAKAWVARNRAALDALHEVARRSGKARYPLPEGSPDKADWPLELLPTATSPLQLDALVCAQNGDSAGAARAVITMIALFDSAEGHPQLISHIMRSALLATASKTTVRLLSTIHLEDDELNALAAAHSNVDLRPGLKWAYYGIRVDGITVFETNPDSHRADFKFLLDSLRRGIETTKQPWFDALKQSYRLAGDVDEVDDDYPVSKMLLPPFGALLVGSSRALAANSAARAAIAVEQYRRDNERLPATLDQVVPDYLDRVPADPFDGQSLRYKPSGGTYILYSVGQNEVDDGGNDTVVISDADLVFRVTNSAINR